jgi:Tol biopolymer transport system component
MYVVDAQGGTPRQLFSPGPRWSASCPCIFRHPWPFNPTYSPDGTQIAYSDGIGDNSHQLRVMNADGSGTHVLVDEQDGHTIHNIAWSPDGEWLAFGLGRASGIYVVNADGSGLALVLPDGTYPYLSPDGSRISYQPRDEQSGAFFPLEIAAADGTHVVEFGYGGSGPWYPLVHPEPEVVGREASEDLTMSLSLVVTLPALVVGAVYLRGRMRRTRGRGA